MLEQFLNLLFPALDHNQAYIEIRAIAPAYSLIKPRVLRYFIKSVQEALECLTPLIAEQTRDLYFGVLPRVKLSGSASAIEFGSTLWVDIDVKQVGSKDTAQFLINRVSKLCTAEPSIMVDSGHGYHAYWLLDKISYQIGTLVAINEYLASQCCGDHTFDAPRILRVPGSYNLKNQDNLIKAEIVSCTGIRHPIERFKLAPKSASIQPKKSAHKPTYTTTSSVDLSRLSPLWKRYVIEGIDADSRNYYSGDRSRLDFAVINKLVEKSYTDDEIYTIFNDPAFGISSKTLSKSGSAREAYINHTIGKAMAGR